MQRALKDQSEDVAMDERLTMNSDFGCKQHTCGGPFMYTVLKRIDS